MPDWWSWTVTAVALLVACVLVPVVWLVARRRWLAGRGRVFTCALRKAGAPANAWILGVARFRDSSFEWYRVFSLSLRPSRTFSRAETSVERVRPPDAVEAAELYRDSCVVELGPPHEGVCLAMARPDLTAFSSWTEAAPPGHRGSQRSPH